MSFSIVFKQLLHWILRRFDLFGLYSIGRKGPLFEDGWFKSFREQASINAKGEPLPWFTYPAIEFIKKRIRSEMSVFEYGCGMGTRWWATRVSEIISVEHDRHWFDNMAHDIPNNVKLCLIEFNDDGAYSNKITEYSNRFDVIVIDGRDRVRCVKNCLKALKPTGVIIFDNSDRVEYIEGEEYLKFNGFKKIEFVGYCPIATCKSETTIFYRAENSLGI
jgi:SAM-dependent methyltransferase